MNGKQVISSDNAPAAIGPYSAAIATESFIFTAGQLGINPENGSLVPGGVQAQTRQALTNLENILKAAGSGLDKVVKITVFLADISDFQPMNEIYAQFFHSEHPARSAFQVGALPRSAAVEIEAIALR
jgi:2-iminobutanoate/2-iminopropanoate deaminase